MTAKKVLQMSASADSSDTKSTGAPSELEVALTLAPDHARTAEFGALDEEEVPTPAPVPVPAPAPATVAEREAATRINCAAIAGGKSSVGAAKQKGDDSGSAMSLLPPLKSTLPNSDDAAPWS